MFLVCPSQLSLFHDSMKESWFQKPFPSLLPPGEGEKLFDTAQFPGISQSLISHNHSPPCPLQHPWKWHQLQVPCRAQPGATAPASEQGPETLSISLSSLDSTYCRGSIPRPPRRSHLLCPFSLSTVPALLHPKCQYPVFFLIQFITGLFSPVSTCPVLRLLTDRLMPRPPRCHLPGP